MAGLEFIVAYLSNLKVLFTILAVVTGIGGGIVTIMAFVATAENDHAAPYVRTLAKWLVSLFLVTGLVACAPDIDDIWKVRVGFIKFQLASPENIQAIVNPENITKAKEIIASIGQDVYCKHVPDSELCKPPATPAPEKK